MEIRIDRDLCESNGICAGLLPTVFDLGDDDVLEVLQPNPPQQLRDQVELAVVRCPRQAISLTG
jgi:ferredoxin